MPINTKVISQLAKSTVDKKTTKKETITRGTLVLDNDGKCFVSLLENSKEFLIPATITTNIDVYKPVTVLIKNHTATVLGNAIEPESTDDDIINSTIGIHSHTWDSVVGLQDELDKKADYDSLKDYATKNDLKGKADTVHPHDEYLTDDKIKTYGYATENYAAVAASDAAKTLEDRLLAKDPSNILVVKQSEQATQDGNGKVIADTYATKKELEELDVKDHNHDDTYAYKEHEHSQYLTIESLNDYATKTYADTQKDNAITSIEERLDSGDLIANKAVNATKATQDGSGNNIVNTYATKEELKGKSDTGHNHDLVYSKLGHDHDSAYVAKVDGKGLSTNDYDDSAKEKVDILYVPVATSGPENCVVNFALKKFIDSGNTSAMHFSVNGNMNNIIQIGHAFNDNYYFNWWNFTTNTLKTCPDGVYLTPENADNPYSPPQVVESKIYNLDNYLPLSGGTLTGDLNMSDKAIYNATLYGKVNGSVSGPALSATKDASGNVITDTYATKDEINNKIDSNGFKTESIENGELNRLTVTDCDGDTATILEIDVNGHMEFGDENTDLYLRGYQERPYYQSHDGDDSKELALLEDVCVVTITDLRSRS